MRKPSTWSPVPVAPQVQGTTLRRLDASGVELIESSYPPGTLLPPHVHDRAYLTLALRGRFRESSTAGSFEFGPGVVMVRPSGTSHADRFGDVGGTALVVVLPRESALGTRLDDIHYATSGPLVAAAAALHRELRTGDSASPLIIDGLLRQAAGWLQRKTVDHDPWATPPWLVRVLERMQDDFLSTPSVEDLAHGAGVHPDHLTSCFRRAFGTTPGRWLRARRLDWAAERLATTSTPISAIAIASGFCDQSHFTNAFHRQFGLTPAKYRAAHARGTDQNSGGRSPSPTVAH